MSKPERYPVPDQDGQAAKDHKEQRGVQEPLSGSKKVKQHNHVSHHNREGS